MIREVQWNPLDSDTYKYKSGSGYLNFTHLEPPIEPLLSRPTLVAGYTGMQLHGELEKAVVLHEQWLLDMMMPTHYYLE